MFYGYWLNEFDPGVFADGPGVPAYSPALGRTIRMTCSGSTTIACRGGTDAVVVIARRTVDRFTLDDALEYAATADLGPVPPPITDFAPIDPAPEPVAPIDDDPELDQPADACDPNYAGACLDPTASDYDCAGGRGDGPGYTGPVRVVGVDRFGLDRDNDGLGCE